MRDEIVLSQNNENYEHEAKSVILNSKQEISTASDRQSLSQASTAEVPPLTVEWKDEDVGKDMTKVKTFED